MKRVRHFVLDAAEGLNPGYFAMVMATGIVAISAQLEEIPVVPTALARLNWTAYGILWLLTLVRLLRFSGRLMQDFADHRRGPGFFTIVAATSVLGAQAFVIERSESIAIVLWYVAAGLWCLITYPFFFAMAVGEKKASLASQIDGGWLVAVVATQSLVVLRAVIGAEAIPSSAVQFLCLCLFLIGGMLYLFIMTLIFYRLNFLPFSPREFDLLYWINMGAAAISVLAGSLLVLRADAWPIVADYLLFVEGVTVSFWAAASWWIPFLIALMLWRYVVRRDALRYEPSFWGMVFPLGMYATATFELMRAEKLPFLDPIPHVFVLIALAAWLLTFCGLLWSLAAGFVTRRPARLTHERSELE
jgi:tellurite resistance protein TehA-like permease